MATTRSQRRRHVSAPTSKGDLSGKANIIDGEIRGLKAFRRRLVILSTLFVLVLAWFGLPKVSERINFPKNIKEGLTEYLFELSLHEYLPDGQFADDVIGNLTTMLKPFWFRSEYGELGSPGIILKSKGAKAHFPVILIPGIISTGLELWEGKECARPYFRDRFWGTLTMLRALILDGDCWLQHMTLDPDTGMDPEGVRLRPAQGLEAADFLLPGFWVWARIIENLAELGYDHNNLQMAAYDWRLNIVALEQRDHYLTRLKYQIELLKRTNGRKVLIMTHSLGASVWHYFMKWVEATVDDGGPVKGGGGGKRWIEDHIESVAHIGGTFLGAPKSISTIVSGESRETAMLGKIETYFLEMFLSRSERVALFRTWSGGLGILPKGGSVIWGDQDRLAADCSINNKTIPLLTRKAADGSVVEKIYIDTVKDLLTAFLPPKIAEITKEHFSVGFATSARELSKNDYIPSKWMNPLETRLPNAPSMKIYCFHGIGKRTERGYVYKDIIDHPNLSMVIDTDASEAQGDLHKGVYRCEGDGTVPLISLGYMGIKGWKRYRDLNPADIPVVVREYMDDISNLRVTDVRGGPKSGDHVDILGNHELTMDLLRLATNFPEPEAPKGLLLKDIIHSPIEEMCEKIDLPLK